MKIQYCLPIIKNTQKEVFETIKKYQSEYDFFEIWILYIKDLDSTFIETLRNEFHEEKIIFVLRSNTHRKVRMFYKRRTDFIDSIRNAHFYLDFDIRLQKNEVRYLQDNSYSLKLLLSYHNFHTTPSNKKLYEILQDMEKFKPYVYKISTLCNSEDDAERLLQLQQHLKQKNLKHIVLGMGELGKSTRILATLAGNEMIFAPHNKEEATAPGQLTKKELEEKFAILNT